MNTIPNTQRRLQPLVVPIVEAVCQFLSPHESFCLATLHRLPMLQAESFRLLHNREFDVASVLNSVPLLDSLWRHCRARGLQPRYTDEAIVRPCEQGNVEILRWWLHVAREVLETYAVVALHRASARGQVRVLDWWKRESGLAVVCETTAMDSACLNAHIAVLQWWKDSGLNLQYSSLSIEFPCYFGDLDVLRWWRDSGLAPKLTAKALSGAIDAGRVDVLDFWLECGWRLFFPASEMIWYKIVVLASDSLDELDRASRITRQYMLAAAADAAAKVWLSHGLFNVSLCRGKRLRTAAPMFHRLLI
ncbi:hypothetical protein DFJ73DRAFT_778005 [Zopfochytrium polystomum]|nr:hypothetical protein DFJ73DRAFT_778005 [Zopfochytrium polystomum]